MSLSLVTGAPSMITDATLVRVYALVAVWVLIPTWRNASFVVLDASPLDDISNTRRISQVYLRGAEVDRDALRAKFMDGVR